MSVVARSGLGVGLNRAGKDIPVDKEQQLIWRKAGFLPSIPIGLISNAVGLLFLLLSQMYKHNEVFVMVA